MTDPTPRQIVDEQAEDEMLWCEAHTIVEDALQKALRRLHAALEQTPRLLSEPPDTDRLIVVQERYRGRVRALAINVKDGRLIGAETKLDLTGKFAPDAIWFDSLLQP